MTACMVSRLQRFQVKIQSRNWLIDTSMACENKLCAITWSTVCSSVDRWRVCLEAKLLTCKWWRHTLHILSSVHMHQNLKWILVKQPIVTFSFQDKCPSPIPHAWGAWIKMHGMKSSALKLHVKLKTRDPQFKLWSTPWSLVIFKEWRDNSNT